MTRVIAPVAAIEKLTHSTDGSNPAACTTRPHIAANPTTAANKVRTVARHGCAVCVDSETATCSPIYLAFNAATSAARASTASRILTALWLSRPLIENPPRIDALVPSLLKIAS